MTSKTNLFISMKQDLRQALKKLLKLTKQLTISNKG